MGFDEPSPKKEDKIDEIKNERVVVPDSLT